MSPRAQTLQQHTNIDDRRRQITAEIAALGPALPGSLVQRRSRCGNAGCRCRADPPQLHGPYWAWTRTVNGKTLTRSLSDEQAARYRPYFDNAARLRDLTDELKRLAAQQVQTDLDQTPR
jgi:hypothetical protein